MCAVQFSCVIPEAPQTPSQVFLFLRQLFYLFFSNRWILDSVSFHIENHKNSTNMMESLFQGALTLLSPPLFLDTISLNSAYQGGISLVWPCEEKDAIDF